MNAYSCSSFGSCNHRPICRPGTEWLLYTLSGFCTRAPHTRTHSISGSRKAGRRSLSAHQYLAGSGSNALREIQRKTLLATSETYYLRVTIQSRAHGTNWKTWRLTTPVLMTRRPSLSDPKVLPDGSLGYIIWCDNKPRTDDSIPRLRGRPHYLYAWNERTDVIALLFDFQENLERDGLSVEQLHFLPRHVRNGLLPEFSYLR